MRLQNAEKYFRWMCETKERISISPKFISAINSLLKSAIYNHNDEIGFNAFCRLWLYLMLHYDTIPTDKAAQKELVRNLMKSTRRTMCEISEALRDAEVDRFIEGKKSLTSEDNKRIIEIRNLYASEELEINLRQMYAQLKLQ